MDDVPVTGAEELERHLQHVVDAPETPLDAKLFDEVELQLTGTLSPFLSMLPLLTLDRKQYPSTDPETAAEPHTDPPDLQPRSHDPRLPLHQARPPHSIHTGAHFGFRRCSHHCPTISRSIREYPSHYHTRKGYQKSE